MIDSTFRIRFNITPLGQKLIEAVSDCVNPEAVPGFLGRIMAPMFGGYHWVVGEITETAFVMSRDFNGITDRQLEVIQINLKSMWYANHDTLNEMYQLDSLEISANGVKRTLRWEYDHFVPNSFARTFTVYVENNPYITFDGIDL